MNTADQSKYAGVFLLSLSIIIYELTLTRIFSVTLYYHLAFLVISIVMLGTSLGAMLIYCYSNKFPQEHISKLLSKYSLAFAFSSSFAVVAHALMPLENTTNMQLQYTGCILATCFLVWLSLVFAGIVISLILTRYPQQTNSLYAADLAGASLGCYGFIVSLGPFDGVSEAFFVSALSSFAAFIFARKSDGRIKLISLIASLVFFCSTIGNSYCVNSLNSGLRFAWTHGVFIKDVLMERWSSLARVTVSGNSKENRQYRTEGYSKIKPDGTAHVLEIDLDGSARTSMIGYDGNPASVQFLKNDVVCFANYLRQKANVLIIGSGGGRDMLAAIIFGQAKIKGVEINPNILNIVNKKYGDFTGHLDKLPNVSFVNDEARSYVSRTKDKFDIIQMSLIDTWAASASGAYVLSENCLYTQEAWVQFLKHLNPKGIFTVSRWYFGDPPVETLRTMSLARRALEALSVSHPEEHIIVVTNGGHQATFLISPDLFSKEDIQNVKDVCKTLGFEYLFGPGLPVNEPFRSLFNPSTNLAASPYNLDAPTDDSPFFFNVMKLSSSIFNWDKSRVDFNRQASPILLIAVFFALYGSLLLVILPLRIVKVRLNGQSTAMAFFFLAIGLGFMFIETSQIQRLIVFLGHPVYGLTCVLFTLLLASSLGSWSVGRLVKMVSTPTQLIACLVFSLVVYGLASPEFCSAFRHAPDLVRIGLSGLALAVPGVCMGFAFPLGMRLADAYFPDFGPWFWGLNGAGSVCGSGLALCVSLTWGINSLFWLGCACYVVALVSYALVTGSHRLERKISDT